MKNKTEKAKIIIIEANKVLMLKKIGKDFKFSFPGGNIKKNETKKEGLIREIKEELGVTVKKNNLKYMIGYSIYTPNSQESIHYYFFKKTPTNFILGEPDKFEMLKWVAIEEVFLFLGKFEKTILKDLLEINCKK